MPPVTTIETKWTIRSGANHIDRSSPSSVFAKKNPATYRRPETAAHRP